MTVPSIEELFPGIMTVLSDGMVHELGEMRDRVADMLSLTDEDRSIMRPRGDMTVLYSNFSWAVSHLKGARFISSPTRSHYRITPLGRRVLDRIGAEGVDKEFLNTFEDYRVFTHPVARKRVLDPEGYVNPFLVGLEEEEKED